MLTGCDLDRNPQDKPRAARGSTQVDTGGPRAAALASILEGNRGIAVAGTHGKTTTTSMTAHVLKSLGENPTALVGGAQRHRKQRGIRADGPGRRRG